MFCFFFQKRKTGKSSVPTQVMCQYQPYCMFIHKQREKHKRILKIIINEWMCDRHNTFISEMMSANSCDVLCFLFLFFVNCDFGTSLFLTMKMGPNIFIVWDYSQTWLFQGLRVCEQCYGLVLWFVLNTATSLTALLLAINYSLKWVFVLHAFIYFLYLNYFTFLIKINAWMFWSEIRACCVDSWFRCIILVSNKKGNQYL